MTIRRLVDLGALKDPRKENGVWTADFAVPKETLLSNSKLQYTLFSRSMQGYAKAIMSGDMAKAIGSNVEGQQATLSGLLGVASQAGMLGLGKWIANDPSRKKFRRPSRSTTTSTESSDENHQRQPWTFRSRRGRTSRTSFVERRPHFRQGSRHRLLLEAETNQVHHDGLPRANVASAEQNFGIGKPIMKRTRRMPPRKKRRTTSRAKSGSSFPLRWAIVEKRTEPCESSPNLP